MFKNFQEYLAERNKHPHGVVSDDKGFANRDYDGGLSLKPKTGKQIKPSAYYAPGAGKNPGLMTADGADRGTPFGSHASPGLTPQNSAPYGQKPVDKTKKVGSKKKKKLPTKKAMKVEQFLNETHDMSNAQFANRMLKDVRNVPTPTVRDMHGKEFIPEPAQTMKYVASLMLTNENIMRRMIREIKRNNGLPTLLAEILQQPETYQQLVEALKGVYGEVAQRKLSVFLEEVSAPRVSKGASGGAFGGGGAGMGGQPGQQGGAFGGGGAGMGGGGGGMQGMGEDEMNPNPQAGGGMDDMGGDVHPDDEHHDDDEDMDDDEEGAEDGEDGEDDDDGEDQDTDDDDDLTDDDDDDNDEDGDGHEEEDEDEEDPHGMGGPGMGGMGGGGMKGPPKGTPMGMGGPGMGGM